jgi:hypothetical protein
MSSRLIISRSGRAAKVPLCRGSVTIVTERIVVRAAGSGDGGHGGRGPLAGRPAGARYWRRGSADAGAVLAAHFTHLGSLFLP